VTVLDGRRHRGCELRGSIGDRVVIILVIIKECTTRVVRHKVKITLRHHIFLEFDLIVTIARNEGFILINGGLLPRPKVIEFFEIASPLQLDGFHMCG
jgi:hypothetical protein